MDSNDYIKTFLGFYWILIPLIYKKSSYLSQAAAYRLKTNYYFQLTKS